MKANLFIVGSPKCGTTSWYEYLKTHPDIFLPELKEPTHFSLDLPGIRWVSSAEDYERLFAPAGNAKYRGEASSSYLFSTAAAEAIHSYNPDAKIIAFVRPQEDFLPSLHHEYLYSFREDRELEEAWRLSGKRDWSNVPSTCQEPRLVDYASRGRFAEQLERYYARFPASQIKVIRFADWVKDPRSTYVELMDFLGLEDDGRDQFPRVNEAKSHRFKLLGRLIQHPPEWAQRIVGWIKKVTGRQTLGLSNKALRVIASKGYTTKADERLKDEIRVFFEDENRRLDALLARMHGTDDAPRRQRSRAGQ